MSSVCGKCGDRGFEEALVCCFMCQDAYEHRYCFNEVSHMLRDVTWACEDCLQSRRSHQLGTKISPATVDNVVEISDSEDDSGQFESPNSDGSAEYHSEIQGSKLLTSPNPEEVKSHSGVENMIVISDSDDDSGQFESPNSDGSAESQSEIEGSKLLTWSNHEEVKSHPGGNLGIDLHGSSLLLQNCNLNAQPIAEPIWKGSFMINYKKHSKVGGVRAHFSTLLSPKAHQEASLIPVALNLRVDPRSAIWPRSFEEAEIIDLYFFPERDRDGLDYDSLVNEMMADDLAMICEVENAELLVFPSLILPSKYQRVQGKLYLWGVFRPNAPPVAVGVEVQLATASGVEGFSFGDSESEQVEATTKITVEETSGCNSVNQGSKDSKKRKRNANKEQQSGKKKKQVAALLTKYKSMEPMVFKEDIMYAFYKGDQLRGTISSKCRSLYVRDVEHNLSCQDWRKIVASPFGNVIKMLRQVSFSSPTVHYVLFKQLASKKKWETWYEIGGKELRFSLKEFALITGLNCGPLPRGSDENTKKKDPQGMKKFFGDPKLSVQDLYERFKNYQVLDNYKFKLGLLLIVEGVIIGGKSHRLVKPGHVKLLDNMDKFWDYPWGRVAYEELHKSLKNSIARRMRTVEKTARKKDNASFTYAIQGMPVMFQVWIWESVKSIGLQFASRLSETTIPRGLHWSLKECPEHGILKLALSEPSLEVLPILLHEKDEKDLLTGCIFRDEVKHNFFDKIVCQAEASKNKEIAVVEECSKGKDSSKGKYAGDTSQMMATIKELRDRIVRLEEEVSTKSGKKERVGRK